MDTFGKRMRAAATNAGFSTSKIAEALSITDGQVRHYFNDHSDPTVKKLLLFSRLTGVSVSELLEPEADAQLKSQTIDFSKSDFINLPIIRNVNDASIEDVSEFAFSIHWLHRLNIDPKNALLVQVFDDKMEPTYPCGSIVLVDKGSTSGPPRTAFAVLNGDVVWIKRVEWDSLSGVTVLSNDNPKIRSDLISDIKKSDAKIIGEVVWSAKFEG